MNECALKRIYKKNKILILYKFFFHINIIDYDVSKNLKNNNNNNNNQKKY